MSKKRSDKVPPKSSDVPSQASSPPQAQAEGREGDNAAERLVKFVESRYRLGLSNEGEPFAVPHHGPNVAILFAEDGEFRETLAADYRDYAGQLVGSFGVTTAFECLKGMARRKKKESLPVRVARHGGEWVIDMADETGRVIVVTPGEGWRVDPRSPVPFRRSSSQMPHVEPCGGATLDQLREALGVPVEKWSLVLAWMLSTFITGVPRTILALEGSGGSGKSSLMKRILDVVDPTSMAMASDPRSMRDWQSVAWSRHVVSLDNISVIPPWFSDVLCRASTGDAGGGRALYHEKKVSITALQVSVVMTTTGIDIARNDLEQRMLFVPVSAMQDDDRKTVWNLTEYWSEFRPRALGALLDALATVLPWLDKVQPPTLPRMADFGQLLAAMDAAQISQGAFEAYLSSIAQSNQDAASRSVFVRALTSVVGQCRGWRGTPTQLVDAVARRVHWSERKELPGPRAVMARLEDARRGLLAKGISFQFKKGQARLIEFLYEPIDGSAIASDDEPTGRLESPRPGFEPDSVMSAPY
jgi:hypothetical protein